MARHDNILDQIRRLHGGVHWKGVEALLRKLGADVYEGAGSTVTFVLDGVKLTVDRPHPRRECGRGLVKRVRAYLERFGKPCTSGMARVASATAPASRRRSANIAKRYVKECQRRRWGRAAATLRAQGGCTVDGASLLLTVALLWRRRRSFPEPHRRLVRGLSHLCRASPGYLKSSTAEDADD